MNCAPNGLYRVWRQSSYGLPESSRKQTVRYSKPLIKNSGIEEQLCDDTPTRFFSTSRPKQEVRQSVSGLSTALAVLPGTQPLSKALGVVDGYVQA